MSASQRNPALSKAWILLRIHRLRENPAVKQQVDAIMALRTGVWGEEYWREQSWKKEDWDKEEMHWRDDLIGFACLTVSPHQGRPAILERVWASKARKTWKALTEFPWRLERIADEVSGINEGDRLFFARRRRNDLDRRELWKLGRTCQQLPDMIRSYAKALRERNAAVAAATPRSGSSAALLDLSDSVKLLTGKYHDNEVAELLNAAVRTLGGVERFDAPSIAQARFRRGKPNIQT